MKHKDNLSYAELHDKMIAYQLEADYTANRYVTEMQEMSDMMVLQSYCDFNLFWIVSMGSFFVHKETIAFLARNISDVRRKFTLKEMFDFDSKFMHLSKTNTINDFDDYKKLTV